MKIEHLAMRLESLAQWATGEGPAPVGIHLLAREAAQQLRRMNADAELHLRVTERPPKQRAAAQSTVEKYKGWRHYAVIDTATGTILFATSEGKPRAAQELVAMIEANAKKKGTRPPLQVRPIMVIEGFPT